MIHNLLNIRLHAKTVDRLQMKRSRSTRSQALLLNNLERVVHGSRSSIILYLCKTEKVTAGRGS